MGNRTKQNFLKRRNSNAEKMHTSPSLAIKEMQIKTTIRFYLTPVRIATIKNTNNVLARMWGKRNPHTVLVGMQAGATTLEKNLEAS
jgi:hypothetical protein